MRYGIIAAGATVSFLLIFVLMLPAIALVATIIAKILEGKKHE